MFLIHILSPPKNVTLVKKLLISRGKVDLLFDVQKSLKAFNIMLIGVTVFAILTVAVPLLPHG
jgi:hypothetical protein